MKHHYCSPSFWQGVRRISALLVFVIFTFVFVVSPIKVKAEAFPIPPVWLPMNPYNAQGLEGNYVLLNDDQKEIVKEIIGAVNIVNLGFGQYVLTNPVIGISATRQFLREYGGTFLETFWTQIMGTSRAMTDFVGSTIYKASTYDTIEEYESDTAPSVALGSQKYFEISPELTVAFKNWYRANGGVEDWQMQTKPFTTTLQWANSSLSGINLSTFNSYYNNYQYHYRFSNVSNEMNSSYYSGPRWQNCIICSNEPLEYSLFLNTSDNKYYLYDINGNLLPAFSSVTLSCLYYDIRGTGNVLLSNFSFTYNDIYNQFFSSSDTAKQAVQRIYNNYGSNTSFLMYIRDGSGYYYTPFFNEIIKHNYIGSSWNNKEEIFNIDDLNIGSTSSAYIDNISNTGYVDINTLIGQISDEVINLREVVEESVLVKDNSEAIPYADSLTKAIDKYLSEPESQVVIPVDIFSGLTGPSGPISYLWFMTKPLVTYTADMLSLLTYDSDGQFQFTGLGYIVVGIVSIGIIGGLVTKCLL